MIVRIHQLPVAQAEADAWPGGGGGGALRGPIAYTWPDDARAFEVLVLDRDEQERALSENFRQAQVRQLIPQVVAALREPGEEVVVRLDGPVSPRELLPSLCHLTDPAGYGRFMVSELAKLDPKPQESMASVRMQPSADGLAALCADAELGLERSVRLRLFCVPERLVNGLLDIHFASDGRWRDILDEAGFVLNAARGLRALFVITRRLDAAEFKSRLMRRLMAAAGPPASDGNPVAEARGAVRR
jgi:hypothetical protein